jgi:hypothetical protein
MYFEDSRKRIMAKQRKFNVLQLNDLGPCLWKAGAHCGNFAALFSLNVAVILVA